MYTVDRDNERTGIFWYYLLYPSRRNIMGEICFTQVKPWRRQEVCDDDDDGVHTYCNANDTLYQRHSLSSMFSISKTLNNDTL